ncbi:hypothetical protein [Streptomyces canus]|uniref:hypothetical protein n=1 Tax=Streptomyces canus TaxID=58343 RepID=UPI002DDA1A71|nr:hypothetical protein [Streptomyces canus]WSD83121.1 hypothetical protein OG925_01685 [Streptomyces canus]
MPDERSPQGPRRLGHACHVVDEQDLVAAESEHVFGDLPHPGPDGAHVPRLVEVVGVRAQIAVEVPPLQSSAADQGYPEAAESLQQPVGAVEDAHRMLREVPLPLQEVRFHHVLRGSRDTGRRGRLEPGLGQHRTLRLGCVDAAVADHEPVG